MGERQVGGSSSSGLERVLVVRTEEGSVVHHLMLEANEP